jgi:hypothetical protein
VVVGCRIFSIRVLATGFVFLVIAHAISANC